MDSIALFGCAMAIIFWGAASIFDKLAVKGIDPFSAVLVRMFFVTAAVLVFCAATGRIRPILEFAPRTYLYLMGSGLAGGLIGQLGYFVAIKHAPVTQVVPITATYPVVAFVLAVLFLREQPTLPKAAGLLLVVCGLLLLSSSRNHDAATQPPPALERHIIAPGSSPPPAPSPQAPPPAQDQDAGR
jgi:transporter family protein